MLANEMPVIGPNALSNVFGVVDTYSTTASYNGQLNGALNPLGSLWTIPSPSQGGNLTLATATGYGAWLTVKYVRYNSTANPAIPAGPAIVYYTDETFTTVSGVFTEGNIAGTGSSASIAGLLLPNTGTVTGIGLGTGVTAALLNGNFCFIAVQGFVPSCYLSAGTQGSALSGVAGNFTSAVTTGILRPYGYSWGAITSTIGDVLVTCGIF
jgi:hypothetical protein